MLNTPGYCYNVDNQRFLQTKRELGDAANYCSVLTGLLRSFIIYYNDYSFQQRGGCLILHVFIFYLQETQDTKDLEDCGQFLLQAIGTSPTLRGEIDRTDNGTAIDQAISIGRHMSLIWYSQERHLQSFSQTVWLASKLFVPSLLFIPFL